MRILLLFVLLLGCSLDSSKKEISNKEKREILNRIKGKDWLYDTIKFNTFKEYYSFIPNLKLPFTIGEDTFPPFEHDSIRHFLSHSNYGLESISVEAKVFCDSFITILFGGQTSGNDFSVYTFDYKGKKIDSAMIFSEMGMGPINEKCITKIDSNLNIHMIYKSVWFKSFDSPDTMKIENSESVFQILNNGKIKSIK